MTPTEEVVTINGKEYTMTEVRACHDFLEEQYFTDEVQRAIEQLLDCSIGDDPQFVSWLESNKSRIIRGTLSMKDEWDQWRAEAMGDVGANYTDYVIDWILSTYSGMLMKPIARVC